MSSPAMDLSTLALRAATHFRLGMQGAGSEGLVMLIDQLIGELQSSPLPPMRLNELSALLGEVLAAQQRHDPLYLADLLQYRLAPLIPRS